MKVSYVTDLQDMQEEAQGLAAIINAKTEEPGPEEDSEAKSMTNAINANYGDREDLQIGEHPRVGRSLGTGHCHQEGGKKP